jgi:rare lipoprotein A (peptidoglycan hydrolase)
MRVTTHRVRTRFFYAWATVRWILLMFVVAPVVQAPALARFVEPNKPLKVWQGVASWYGGNFHGRLTAYGETYDMFAMTAAHPTLPMGSLVRVVNIQNGRSRVVRINDRGPYFAGRELDLSFQAAEELGMAERGIARVQIELLEVPKGRWPLKRAVD